jgi:hypothetical protein
LLGLSQLSRKVGASCSSLVVLHSKQNLAFYP